MQRHRIRQKFLENFGRFHDALEAVAFDASEKLLEAENFFERARAGERARRHKPAKNADQRSGKDRRDDPSDMSHASSGSERTAEDEKQNSYHNAGADVGLPNRVRTMEIVAVGHQCVEYAAAERRQMRIEMILQLGELYGRDRAIVKKRRKHFEFVRTDGAPLGWRPLEVKNVFLAVSEAEEMALVFLLDREGALHGEIDESCGDIAHRGFVVNDRAALARREFIGRLVLHGDGAAFRVAPARPPEPQHDDERDDGEK